MIYLLFAVDNKIIVLDNEEVIKEVNEKIVKVIKINYKGIFEHYFVIVYIVLEKIKNFIKIYVLKNVNVKLEIHEDFLFFDRKVYLNVDYL